MTGVINEVVAAVIAMMNATQPFSNVTRGALPTGKGLVCEVGPTVVNELYWDKNTFVPLDITINGKHPNLKTLSDAIIEIHSALTRTKEYPEDTENNRWQITDIKNATLPQVIGRENNNDWLMASGLSVEFYWKGD